MPSDACKKKTGGNGVELCVALTSTSLAGFNENENTPWVDWVDWVDARNIWKSHNELCRFLHHLHSAHPSCSAQHSLL